MYACARNNSCQKRDRHIMKTDTVETLLQVVLAIAVVVIGVKFIGDIFQTIVNHPVTVAVIAIAASGAAALYFSAKPRSARR